MPRTTMRIGTLVLGVMAMSSVVLGSPAQAASGVLRLGHDQNLGGENYTYSTSNRNLGGPGDEASSARNESDSAWVLYDDTGFRDRRYCIRPGEYVRDLHNEQWNFGDKISSVRRLSTSSCRGYPTFFN